MAVCCGRGIFAGAVLAALPEHFGFKTASWNATACYHGKTPWVDGGFSASKRLLNSYSMKAGNKGIWSARQAVEVLNQSRGRSIAAVGRTTASPVYADTRKNRKTGGYYTPKGWVKDEKNGRVGQPKAPSPLRKERAPAPEAPCGGVRRRSIKKK